MNLMQTLSLKRCRYQYRKEFVHLLFSAELFKKLPQSEIKRIPEVEYRGGIAEISPR